MEKLEIPLTEREGRLAGELLNRCLDVIIHGSNGEGNQSDIMLFTAATVVSCCFNSVMAHDHTAPEKLREQQGVHLLKDLLEKIHDHSQIVSDACPTCHPERQN